MNTTDIEIRWNGKTVDNNNDRTTTELDKPFVISRMDLSCLNSLLGTHFRPMVWIGIPKN